MTRARVISVFLGLVVLAGVAVGGGYLWIKAEVGSTGPLQSPAIVFIDQGEGLSAISRKLASAGVIERPWLFEIEARLTSQTRALKPGEYEFLPGVSVSDALSAIVKRDIVVHFLTIPEGVVSSEVLRLLSEAELLTGEVSVEIQDGDILPETYSYEWQDERDALLRRMIDARNEALNSLWENRAPDLPLETPEEALVLASIVEKETGVAAERRRVAAVFINRLKHGMKLQSDPTVIYGLAPETGNLGRPLSRADLAQATPFNTYVINALPPAPICHPGRASIAAVLNPVASQELYFVADGTGGHAFARTLQEHNRNVAKWRQIERQRRSRSGN